VTERIAELTSYPFTFEVCLQGDSGGPLVKQENGKRWDIIGIAIAGTRTCSTHKSDVKPGIYTRLSYYRDFIDVATGGSCDDFFRSQTRR